MATSNISIQPPIAGIDRAWAFQSQPPFSLPDAVNCRARCVFEDRQRLGSRPGLAKAYQTLIIGPDAIVDGTFANADGVSWNGTPDASWTIGGGFAKAIGVQGTLTQTAAGLVIGATYRVTFTISTYTAGTIWAALGTTLGTARTSNGTFVETIIANGTTFSFTLLSTFRGWISNVLVERIDPIRLLNVCRTLNVDASSTFFDDFPGSDVSSSWTQGVWTLNGRASDGVPVISGGFASTTLTPSATLDLRTAKTAALSYSTTTTRSLEMNLDANPFAGFQEGSRAYLMLDMNNTTPDPNTGGIMVDFFGISVGLYGFQLFIDGNNVASRAVEMSTTPSIAKVSIDNTETIRVYMTNATTPDLVHMPVAYTPSGTRIGFGLHKNSASLFTVRSASLTFVSSGASGGIPPRALIASASGLVYRENTSGAMTLVAPATCTLASDRLLSSVNRLQKLYIADYALRRKGTTGDLTFSSPNGTLTDASGDFINNGVTVADDRLELVSGTGVTPGIYPIVSRTATTVVFTGNGGTATGTAKYRVVRGPKVFDSATLTLELMPIGTVGTSQCPVGCTIVTQWLDRLIFTGDPDNPHVAYFSKAGFITETETDLWDYSQTGGIVTPGQAFAYDPNKTDGAGYIGDAVTCAFPHGDDYLAFCGADSVSMQRGDPTFGGQLDLVTRDAGIIDKFAFCYTPEQFILGLGNDGLYLFAPGPGTKPERISRERLPRELMNINVMLFDVQLVYGIGRQGAHIFVTPKTGGATSHWWFDWAKKAFWREAYPSSMEPTASCTHAVGGAGTKETIFGCRDAYIRRMEDAQTNDDGTAFSSFALLGPFNLGHPKGIGLLKNYICDLARDSGDITVDFFMGNTPEEARYATTSMTITVTAGGNITDLARLRGGACFIRVSSAGVTRWAIDAHALEREVVGMRRAD